MSTTTTGANRSPASHGPGRTKDAQALEQIAVEAQQRFDEIEASSTREESTQAVIDWAAGEFGSSIAVACSMASDTVLVDVVSRRIKGVDVLFLDTGYHFPETLQTRDDLAEALHINLVDVKPALTVAEQDARFGAKLYASDPGRCCGMRKVEPLGNELAGYESWVTGVRREDNALRADAHLVEWDATHQMVKLNPFAAWHFDDLLDYAQTNLTPINPLLAQGYPSIGCAPCTRKVAPGEDPRAGRWAGLGKTECGIHL